MWFRKKNKPIKISQAAENFLKDSQDLSSCEVDHILLRSIHNGPVTVDGKVLRKAIKKLMRYEADSDSHPQHGFCTRYTALHSKGKISVQDTCVTDAEIAEIEKAINS